MSTKPASEIRKLQRPILGRAEPRAGVGPEGQRDRAQVLPEWVRKWALGTSLLFPSARKLNAIYTRSPPSSLPGGPLPPASLSWSHCLYLCCSLDGRKYCILFAKSGAPSNGGHLTPCRVGRQKRPVVESYGQR
jgi:hypothetical protein